MFNKQAAGFLLFLPFFLWSCEDEGGDAVSCDGADLSASIVAATNADCGASNGTIEISTTGGEQPYEYSLNGGTYEMSSLIRGVYAGLNEVTVRDNNGCTTTVSATVGKDGGVSYVETVAAILEENCSLPTCHVNGTSRQDFTIPERVRQLSQEIKRRTQTREMPPNGTLEQSQIDLIACWVDEGAQDN